MQMKNANKEFSAGLNAAKKSVNLLIGVVLGSALVTPTRAMLKAQVPGAESADVGQSEMAERRDAWRLVPKAPPPAPTDPKLLNILDERAREFDRLKPERALEEPQPEGEGHSWSLAPGNEEIPFFENEAIVVASFEDYEVYLTPSHRSIYTDISLAVEQVLDGGPSQVTEGQEIDLLIPGGTVLLSDGSTLSDDINYDMERYCLQPGHRYVLFLQYYANGDFFSAGDDWELANGIVLPNSPRNVYLATSGRSKYSGMPEASFLESLGRAVLNRKLQTE